MRMKRLAVVSGIMAALLLLLMGGATLLVRYLVSPDAVRKIVLPRVEKSLSRHVEIGDVQIGIFSGIALRELKVYEKDGKEIFVSLSAANLRFQLLPLLSRRVVVDEIVLRSPKINIVRNSDGSFNFSDLLKREKPKETEEEKTALSFAVARFSIRDGSVDYNDLKGIAGSPFTYGISSVDVGVKDFTTERPFPVTLSARVPGAALGYEGSAQLAKEGPLLKGEFSIADCELAGVVAGLPSGISGKMVKLSPKGSFALKLNLEGGIKNPYGMVKSGEIQLKEIGITAGSLPTALSGVLSLVNGAISSQGLVAAVGKNSLALQLKTSPLEKKPIDIELSASGDAVDLDATAKAEPEKAGTAPTPAKAKEPGPLNLPLTAHGSLRLAAIKYHGLTISGVALRYRLQDNKLQVDDLKGGVAGGTFADSTRINLAVPGFSYSTQFSLTGVQVEKLAEAFAPKAKGSVSGVISARGNITGSGTSSVSAKKNLAGSGEFAINNGKLSGSGFIAELARFLGSEDLRVIRFSTFDGTYRIAGEQLMLDSQLTGSDVRMKPKGRIGFDKSMDMDMETRLAPRFTGKVAQSAAGGFITDEQGWGVLPLKAGGTVSSPRFSLSSAAIGRRLKEKAGEVIREKLFKKEGGAGQEQPLEKTIRGLFGN